MTYLRLSGRAPEHIERVRRVLERQGMFAKPEQKPPLYSDVVTMDMEHVVRSVAGPCRPQDRVALSDIKTVVSRGLRPNGEKRRRVPLTMEGQASSDLCDGAVVIAAITSCTNTSNPAVMIGAGLLARNAVKLGLKVPAYVKTSLAPGSRVVTHYLHSAGLDSALETLGFHTVAYGCTTCIGNSGPLCDPVSRAIESADLNVCSVLSGNRNFEGRIHAQAKGSYLASPLLVVAFALAGRMDIDLEQEPLGFADNGQPVYLRDIWPTRDEIEQTVNTHVKPHQFRDTYAKVFDGNAVWNAMDTAHSQRYRWDANSTYIRQPPFLRHVGSGAKPLSMIRGARVLLMLGDTVTTDHISPAGSIAADSPAARYLQEQGVAERDWNSYGSRRGNHEVMGRGTFANIRIRNQLVPEHTGGKTRHFDSGDTMPVFDAAERYRSNATPLVVLAGREYGTGSSRDWAAKGAWMLGVRVIIAESYERIHRSNLAGMGILPLQFEPGQSCRKLELTGLEIFDIQQDLNTLAPGQPIEIRARNSGRTIVFSTLCRIDTPVELTWFMNGGILPATLRSML